MNYSILASKESIEKTAAALRESAGFEVFVDETGEDAKKRVLSLIPNGAEIMTMTSVTLESTGIAKELNDSGNYAPVRDKLAKLNKENDAQEMKRLGAGPEWAIGSVHAVTEVGEALVASNTGSQLPAYTYGAGKVIWVVGGQKIVPDRETAMKRIYEYVLPLESERANKAYDITSGSHVSKLLIFNREVEPGRVTVILVNEVLGF
jgi:hypothetical protein